MPIRINSRGMPEYITDEFAHALAAEEVTHTEGLVARAERNDGVMLSRRDSYTAAAGIDEAQRLLTATGDLRNASNSSQVQKNFDRFHAPAAPLPEVSQVATLPPSAQARKVAETYRLVEQLGTEHKQDPVRLRSDLEAKTYTLSGGGLPEQVFKDYSLAESAAKRRASGRP